MVAHVAKWWKEAVVYQIYPASFKDSNGDGIGDIPGIISKLDYIKNLGVDVIWVCPFYKSPQYDMGYDIADYQAVYEPYGKLSDVDAMIEGAHKRGIKIVFDLVVNHTSHLHPWFKESRSSKTNPKRDWYFWRPARYIDGKRMPPCNWKGNFGGSVWEWDETTQEYYLHYFTPEQPDLNWENPEVRRTVYAEAVNFWLDRGVDGFRIDTVNMYSKYLDFPDVPVTEPTTPWQRADKYFSNGPRLHEFLKEMNKETFSKYDAVSIGECPNTHEFQAVLPFVSAQEQELDMVFQFDIAAIDHGGDHHLLLYKEWKLPRFKEITLDAQRLAEPSLEAWVTTYLENHDQARSVTRFASDSPQYRIVSAKMLAIYLLSLSGTPFIYQGEELGMINAPISWPIEEYKDVGTINYWKEIKESAEDEPGLLEEGLKGAQLTARDHSRTPMQWDTSPQAGFTTSNKPWMRVNDSYVSINAAQQEKDDQSVLAFYKTLLRLRKEYKDLFVYGAFELCDPDNEHTMVFIKRDGEREAVIGLNFTGTTQPFASPKTLKGRPSLLISSHPDVPSMELQPYEGRIYLTNLSN